MFSTLSPASLFDARLERPLRAPSRKNTTKPKGPKETTLRVANLNLALSSLNPTRPHNTTTVDSPLHSPSLPTSPHSLSTIFMSPTHSFRSSGPDIWKTHNGREIASRSSSLREPTAKSRSQIISQYTPSSHEHPASHPAIQLREGYSSYTPRSSFDSVSSSSSERSFREGKERKVPIVVPPPLRLDRSNLHRSSLESPVIEISAPPRVESKGVLSEPRRAPVTPTSPDFQIPSVEEQQRRRLEKVVRTLGEDVPAELVYRSGVKPIIDVHIFPDPPTPVDNDTFKRREQKGNSGLKRRGSFTLSAFPNLSSMTATLLPQVHARGKSREIEHMDIPSTSARRSGENIAEPLPTNTAYVNRSARPRPESGLLSPMIFRRPVSQLVHLDDDDDDGDILLENSQRRRETDRASKLARRASLHTTTLLPSSPTRDSYYRTQSSLDSYPDHIDPLDTPRAFPRRNGHYDALEQASSTPQTLSPMEFHEPAPPRPPPKTKISPTFHLVVDDHGHAMENEDLDDTSSSGSRTPTASAPRTPNSMYMQSENSHDNLSDTHLPIYTRPDTPFASAAVPLRAELLIPPGVGLMPIPKKTKARRDLVTRREKRQGWSGEWNRGDMQDVIQTLRSLK